MTIFQDNEGNQSSKRWIGASCFVFAAGLAVLDIFKGGASPNTVQIINTFMIAGTTLLVGGTAAEQIGKIGA